MKLSFLKILTLLAFTLTTSCGSDPAVVATTSAQTLSIIEFSFVPQTLTVSAGDTIFVYNQDDTTHQILSQSAPNLFDDTGDFSSTVIDSGDVGTITVPESSTAGSTLHFYSTPLEGSMATPNGSIEVE